MTILPEPLASLLFSDDPAADIPEAQCIFAPFIGSWDLVVTWYDADGVQTRQENGEWHFSWVLNGRGIQDVWIVPGTDERARGIGPYEYGTSIRFYDPKIAAWRSTWIGPSQGVVTPFLGHGTIDGVLLETLPDSEIPMRWSFRDITANHFIWENHRNIDVWRLVQDFKATRRQ